MTNEGARRAGRRQVPLPALPRGDSAAAYRLRAGAYIGALVLAEVLVTQFDARLGGVLHALILMLLLQHGSRSAVLPERRLYLSLSLVPLLRLLGLSLPLDSFPDAWPYAVVAAPLLLGMVVAARAMGYGPRALGLDRRWSAVPLHVCVGLVGIPLGLLEYQLIKPAPLTTELSWATVLIPAGALLMATGLIEEVLFRGLLQRTSTALLGRRTGPLLITCLWAGLHLGFASWPILGLALLTGGLFAVVAGRSGSVWGVGLAHGLLNVVLLLLAPLLINPGAP